MKLRETEREVAIVVGYLSLALLIVGVAALVAGEAIGIVPMGLGAGVLVGSLLSRWTRRR